MKPRKLLTVKISSVDILPKSKHLSFSKPTACNIFPSHPKPEYHPHIVEACRLMYGKQPDQLTPDESQHFRGYQQWKCDNGEPIEEDFIYKPS